MNVMCMVFLETPSGIDVILPKMVEFIPMLVAFILMAIVLGKFGWPVFEKMLDKRKTKIESDLAESEAKRIEAEKLVEEYKKQLEEAHAKGEAIIKEAKSEAQATSSQIEKEAKVRAKSATDKAKLAIKQDKRIAEQELKEKAVDIAVSVTERIVGDNFSDADHRKLIEQYVKEAGTLRG